MDPDMVDQSFREQMMQMISGGYDHADTLHNVFLDYGYPAQLKFEHFWNMYRRFGIARNIVDLPVDTGWMTFPIISGTPAVEAGIKELDRTIRLFARLRALDVRQRVGRYAGLFVRVRDGRQPNQPLADQLGGIGAIAGLMPLYEGNLRVKSVDEDPASATFGHPTEFSYDSAAVGGRNEHLSKRFDVHPSRVIMVAEGSEHGGIYGESALEAPYNSLLDLRKIIGAGGEGFYKNASKDIMFETKEVEQLKNNPELAEKINEELDDFIRNRMRRSLMIPGFEAKTLSASLASPQYFFDSALNDCAAASKIPATILIGKQTGRLASTEDSRHFLSLVMSRRKHFMTDMVRDVIDWFMRRGVLPAGDYDVGWDDLLAASYKERLEAAREMADINRQNALSGGDAPFTDEEVREAAGYPAHPADSDDEPVS